MSHPNPITTIPAHALLARPGQPTPEPDPEWIATVIFDDFLDLVPSPKLMELDNFANFIHDSIETLEDEPGWQSNKRVTEIRFLVEALDQVLEIIDTECDQLMKEKV